jgi:signal transduction histidine kinase
VWRTVSSRLRTGRVAGLPLGDVILAGVLLLLAVIWVLGQHRTGQDTVFPEAPIPPMKFRDASRVLKEMPGPVTSDPLLPAVVANVGATAALALRRRRPFAAFVIAFAPSFILRAGITWPGFIALLVVCYSLVAHGRRLALSIGAVSLVAIWAAAEFSQTVPSAPSWVAPFALLGPLALFATVIRSTRARADSAARRALALERERDAATRAAIAEERARIARELHDVVSHHVSVMVIQAGAAQSVIHQDPDLAAGALAAIGTSGRAAMGELRTLLGMIEPLDDALHPQPGLADLEQLVATVRAAGQPVTVHPYVGALPVGVDLTAYRVVQEGLTNALRYARGAPTYVVVSRNGDTIEVEVRNDAPAMAAAPPAQGTGSGLLGLAERLRLFHGTLDCGHRVGGGFRLRAHIPLPVDA